jgi:hypothetical protein
MSGECDVCGHNGCVEDNHDAPEDPPQDYPDLRIFWSPDRGFIGLDADQAVWELDFSGYRITELPSDAYELAQRDALVGAARAVVASLETAKTSSRLDGDYYTRHYELLAELIVAVREVETDV